MSTEEIKHQNGSPEYNVNGNGGYNSGNTISRFITPGGHPMDNSQPALPVFHRKFGNPAPLGLMAFGGTTVLLSLINLEARSVTVPNVLVGVALMYGGACQMICGIMEFVSGNSFGTCAFTGYGAFWISWACIEIPWFGIVDAYKKTGSPAMLDNALGLYLCMWGIVTFMLTFALLRASVALVFVFAVITLTFFLLGAGKLVVAEHAALGRQLNMAGGGFGIIGGFAAMYTAMSGLLDRETSYFTIPVGSLAPK